jgi:hypothetical protein
MNTPCQILILTEHGDLVDLLSQAIVEERGGSRHSMSESSARARRAGMTWSLQTPSSWARPTGPASRARSSSGWTRPETCGRRAAWSGR